MMDEARLIAQLRNGVEEAFTSAYDLYASQLLSYCYRLTKSREDSEEIVQDVFVNLWLGKEKIRNDLTLRPLLFTMVRHRIVDVLRRRVRSVVYEDYMSYSEQFADSADHYDYDKYVELVRHSIEQLPPAQRRIALMSKLEGRSCHEIAKQLAISEKTVKNQLSAANRKLLSILKKTLIIISVFLFLLHVPFWTVHRLI